MALPDQLSPLDAERLTLGESSASSGKIAVRVMNPDGSNVSGGGTAPATSTLSNVVSSASSVTILASNANRQMATVVNDSTQVLYVKFGSTASSSSYTVQLAAGAYYELPRSQTGVYTGIITGIWASANGNARVTEITP